MVQKTIFGSSIEALVCAFLELHGLQCVQKNYVCRLGEIDLVMLEQKSNTLVFVEVRFRATAHHGSASETVDWSKQRKLKRAVLHYLQKHSDAKQMARIDVVGVCNLPTSDYKPDSESRFGVSTHRYKDYLLRWTQNAIED